MAAVPIVSALVRVRPSTTSWFKGCDFTPASIQGDCEHGRSADGGAIDPVQILDPCIPQDSSSRESPGFFYSREEDHERRIPSRV